MKTILMKIGRIVLLSLGFMLWWMIGFGISQALFQAQFPPTEASESTVMACLLFIAGLETTVLWWANEHLSASRSKRFGIILLLLFGLQFFMSQNESWYFKDAVGMSERGILQTVFGGLLLALGFSALLVFSTRKAASGVVVKNRLTLISWNLVILAFVIYPLIYFLAGHFVAWQFPAIRQYYTGEALNRGFIFQFKDYLQDGLYFFQILRGALWILIAWPFLQHFQGSRFKASWVLGILFSVLHCTQLLLPNPYMPAEVRYAHLLETASSVFLWGFLVAWVFVQKRQI